MLDRAPPRVLGATGKLLSGWVAARGVGAGVSGRVRAGSTLIARGEFSIVIAALGSDLDDADELAAVAAAYVLLTAIAGPIATRYADRLAAVGSRTGTQEAAR